MELGSQVEKLNNGSRCFVVVAASDHGSGACIARRRCSSSSRRHMGRVKAACSLRNVCSPAAGRRRQLISLLAGQLASLQQPPVPELS